MSIGCSARQDTHQEAHTLNNQTLPFKSAGVNLCSGVSSLGAENSGAGLFINGDGISLGLRFKPSARKTAITMNQIKGIINLSIMIVI